MKSFVSRRLRNAALTGAVLATVMVWAHRQELQLQDASFGTGYVLLAALIFLAMFNLRKKLAVLPLSSSSDWLQAHLYVGIGTAVLFGLHIGWRVPAGPLETTLAVLYLATFASGVLGLYWTRTIPPRLTAAGEEVIYERIPWLRNQLRDRAQTVVLETVRGAGATTLGEFYGNRLQGFFEHSPTRRYYLSPTKRLRQKLLAELTDIKRYLSEAEQESCEQLFALIRKRDALDYHAALQWRLKVWLYVHLGLTYPLLTVASMHGLLAHLFDGRVP